MNLPFTPEHFFGVFRTYNEAIWPAQVFLVAAALGAAYYAARPAANSDRGVALVLSLVWLWTGLIYHLLFFTAINPAAYLFGGMVLVQGVFFLWIGVVQNRLKFRAMANPRGVAGALLMSYALVIYPLLGAQLGRSYPSSPTFGTPCPTTIFTFGILLWTSGTVPRYLLIIPALWSLIGFTAAFSLGVTEDLGLLVAGVTATGLLWQRRAV